jgi:hypothetical protein
MQNRDGLKLFGRLVGTATSGFWTPGRTVVDPSIPYLPLENPGVAGPITGDSNVALPFAVAGDVDVVVQGSGTVALPQTAVGAGSVLVAAAGAVGLPMAGVGAAAVIVQADASVALPFAVAGDATVAVNADSTLALPFSVIGAAVVGVAADGAVALPFAVSGAGALSVQGESSVALPFQAAGAASLEPLVQGRRFYVWQPWPKEKKHPSPPTPAEPDGFALPVPQAAARPPERPPEPDYIGEPEEVGPAAVPVWLQRIAAGGSGLSRRVAAALESAQAVVVRRQEAERRRERQVRRNEQDIQDVDDLLRTLDMVDQI